MGLIPVGLPRPHPPAELSGVAGNLMRSIFLLPPPTLSLQLMGQLLPEEVAPSMLGCSLMYLDLQGNHISGSLPETITALHKLESLSLGQNSITGT